MWRDCSSWLTKNIWQKARIEWKRKLEGDRQCTRADMDICAKNCCVSFRFQILYYDIGVSSATGAILYAYICRHRAQGTPLMYTYRYTYTEKDFDEALREYNVYCCVYVYLACTLCAVPVWLCMNPPPFRHRSVGSFLNRDICVHYVFFLVSPPFWLFVWARFSL